MSAVMTSEGGGGGWAGVVIVLRVGVKSRYTYLSGGKGEVICGTILARGHTSVLIPPADAPQASPSFNFSSSPSSTTTATTRRRLSTPTGCPHRSKQTNDVPEELGDPMGKKVDTAIHVVGLF